MDFIEDINIFDIFIFIIFTYNIINCFFKGFSLSFISLMKWVLSLIITIILTPKLQPWVNEYIESQFINSIGLSVLIFFCSLFMIIVISKSLSRVVTWTGVGSIDKSFGLVFGFFKGYIVSVCLFTAANWFYSYENWGISIEKAMTFNIVKTGSEILIKEFPNNKDFINTKETIEKI